MVADHAPIRLKHARPWAPRRAIAPRTCAEKGTFVVAGNGSPGCYGGWDLAYPAPRRSEWVRFRVKCSWRELERSYDSVNVVLTCLDKHGAQIGWQPAFPRRVTKRHVVYEARVALARGAALVVARLFIAWSARGEIRWAEPRLTPAPPPRPRRMRLGAAGGPVPPGRRTVRKNTQFYLALCEEAARNKIDLLCLPEVMLTSGINEKGERLPRIAFQVPGRETEPFQSFARRRRMALCFSLWEKNRELVHNTAVLINKKGKLVGKYRKVHLAQPDELWQGVTPGHDFPVYRLGNARVAMNICMDSMAVESSRVPARNGADIICLPIMGDARASVMMDHDGPHEFDLHRWTQIMSVRAMDNQVFMLISRNRGVGSGIFSPRGKVLAVSGGGPLVYADVDLEDLPRYGATYRGITWHMRRDPTYVALVEPPLPDPFAGSGAGRE